MIDIKSITPQLLNAAAASLSAVIAILLFIYATRNLHFTKRLEKVRLTLAELHRDDLKAARDEFHTFLLRHTYSLTSARTEADHAWPLWYSCERTYAVKKVFDKTLHPFTSLSTLYARGFLDKRTIRDRYALLFARYYYVFYTYLETLQIQGDQTYTALVLGRESLYELRRRPSELLEENPELRTFIIPPLLTRETVTSLALEAMGPLRERRSGRLTAGVSTANTSRVAF